MQDGSTHLLMAAQQGHVEDVRSMSVAGAEKEKQKLDGAIQFIIAEREHALRRTYISYT